MNHKWRTRLAAAVLVPGLATGGVVVATAQPASAASYVTCRDLQTVKSRAVYAVNNVVYYGVYTTAGPIDVKIMDQTNGVTLLSFTLWGPEERYGSIGGLTSSHGYIMQIHCNFHADGYIG